MAQTIWDEMRRMRKRMDAMFEEFFKEPFFSSKSRLLEGGGHSLQTLQNYEAPLSDMWETETAIKAEIDLPGTDKKDIKLNITKGAVEIKAEKKREEKEEKKGVFHAERSYQGFYRCFALPETADIDKAEAKYENGVLKLSIPKKALPEHKPKQIEIK